VGEGGGKVGLACGSREGVAAGEMGSVGSAVAGVTLVDVALAANVSVAINVAGAGVVAVAVAASNSRKWPLSRPYQRARAPPAVRMKQRKTRPATRAAL
jgi:hypothetical protein